MRRVVIEPAAFLEWFGDDLGPRRALRRDFEAGALALVVPSTFAADVMAAAATNGWSAPRLERLGLLVEQLDVDRLDPPTPILARWLSRGLPGMMATYAALAEASERPLVARSSELRRRAAALLER